jgi:hypothetical protein
VRTIEVDGATWVRHAERRCARCEARTYRISRRVAHELIFRPLPGPHGCNTFATEASGGPRRLVALCTRCLDALGGLEAARAWVRELP